jgi:hypothetical protein
VFSVRGESPFAKALTVNAGRREGTRTVPGHAFACRPSESASGCPWGIRGVRDRRIADHADVPRDQVDARSRAQTLYAPRALSAKTEGSRLRSA